MKKNQVDVTPFVQQLIGNPSINMGNLPIDMRQGYMPFFRMLPTQADPVEFYLSLSMYGFYSLFLTPEEQMAYINTVFCEPDELNMVSVSLLKSINICPLCAKYDIKNFNTLYFHRVHQLPDICFCPKHQVRLLSFYGGKKRIINFNLEDYRLVENNIPEKDLKAYANYVSVLFDSNVTSDLSELSTIIRQALIERGYYGSHSKAGFQSDIDKWEHKALFSLTSENFNPWISRIKTKKPSEILGLLMFLFPNPEDLIQSLSTGKKLCAQYTCDNCETVYFGTPFSHEIGWGCPECNKKLTYSERYTHLVHVLGNGEYDVRENIVSPVKKIQHYHRVCGQLSNIKPKMFIFYGERCRCRGTKIESKLRQSAEMNGLKFISYDHGNRTVTLFHPKCGNSFTVHTPAFRHSLRCRICEQIYESKTENELLDSYVQRVQRLVGDEYSIISFSKNCRRMKVRHNKCALEYDTELAQFFRGFRCPQCTVIPLYDEINQVLTDASDGKYILNGQASNKIYFSVLNTENGDEKTFSKYRILQELTRLTPSKCFSGLKTGQIFPDWSVYLEIYKEYREEYGQLPHRNTIYKGKAIGNWCFNMRKLRTNGKLSEDRIQILTAAGFEWETKRVLQKKKQ